MYRWRPLTAASVVAVLLTTALAVDARVTPCNSLAVTVASSEEKSALPAYQWLCQSIMIPVRKPVGRTFCPMSYPFSG